MNPLDFPFSWGKRTYVMGILNLTPDSFSGDGLLHQDNYIEAAVEQAISFAAAGADILDLGAESTRPGSQPVPAQQELERLLPVLLQLKKADLNVVLSVDTYKASVAEAALNNGADWINDVWGLRADAQLAEVVAQHHVPVILMHNRSKPTEVSIHQHLGSRYVGVQYKNLLEDIKVELLESVKIAHEAGILDKNIILDPGIGFGKTVEQNLELINHLDAICSLGYPVLFGPSRKGFIGFTLNLPAEQRIEGTAAAVTVGIVRGADIIRVHDVEVMVRVARMTDAFVRGNMGKV